MALLLAAFLFLAHGVEARQADATGLSARLDFFGPAGPPFTYAGDPLTMRISLVNEGSASWSNEKGIDVAAGFTVVREGAARIPIRKAKVEPQSQPALLLPGAFFGRTININDLVEKPLEPGTYTILWEHGNTQSNSFSVKVIPKFDASAPYVAIFETDYGMMEFELLTGKAARHVQNLYNLAHQGFYDNTVFHQIIKGVELRGGDPEMSGKPFPHYPIEPEISPDLKHRRGTLSMLRLAGGQFDSGLQFVITLSEIEQYDGGLTIFGQLRRGEEVLSAIENIPTTGQVEAPFYRPITTVALRSLTVRRAGEDAGH